MTIRVLSFDFDGCLFHGGYLSDPTVDKSVIQHNLAFIQTLKEDAHKYSKTIAMLGTSRQSMGTDFINWKKKNYQLGSSYTAIQKLSAELDAVFDDFLLSDIYSDKDAGHSFQNALIFIKRFHDKPWNKELFEELSKHPDWKFDETKVSILYAQMHKIACDNPDEAIVFDFYDDRGLFEGTDDILEHLRNFFNNHPELIPEKVELRLHHYAGKQITHVASISGKGFPDVNFRQTVKDMAKVAARAQSLEEGDWNTPLFISHHVRPHHLKSRKKLKQKSVEKPKVPGEHDAPISDPKIQDPPDEEAGQKAKDDASEKSADDEDKPSKNQLSARALRNFEAQLSLLDDQIMSLKGRKCFVAVDAAEILHRFLCEELETFKEDHDYYATFADKSRKAIAAAHEILDEHRGFKEILYNLLLAITVIGLLINGIYNLTQNRNFFFVAKTKSQELLEDLEQGIGPLSPIVA